MKYIIASEGKDLDAKMSRRFGHANYHLLVDTDNMNSIRTEDGNVDGLPAHGMKRFATIEKLDGVITWNIGPHAFEEINRMNVPVYVVRNTTVKEAIEKVSNGEVAARENATMKKCHHENSERKHMGQEHHRQRFGKF